MRTVCGVRWIGRLESLEYIQLVRWLVLAQSNFAFRAEWEGFDSLPLRPVRDIEIGVSHSRWCQVRRQWVLCWPSLLPLDHASWWFGDDGIRVLTSLVLTRILSPGISPVPLLLPIARHVGFAVRVTVWDQAVKKTENAGGAGYGYLKAKEHISCALVERKARGWRRWRSVNVKPADFPLLDHDQTRRDDVFRCIDYIRDGRKVALLLMKATFVILFAGEQRAMLDEIRQRDEPDATQSLT